MVAAFVLLLFIALIPAFTAKKKGRSFALWYCYGLCLFIFAFIHALLLEPNEEAAGMRKCPQCATIIKDSALICPSCRTNFSHSIGISNTTARSNPTKKYFEGEMNITIPSYQLYLTRKFFIEKNNTLNKFIIGDDVFDSLEQSLAEADHRYRIQVKIDRDFLDGSRNLAEPKLLSDAELEAKTKSTDLANKVFYGFFVLAVVSIIITYAIS